MASYSGCALDSKQIHGQLYDDSDSFSEFSHHSDIDMLDHTDPDLSDSYSNFDDGQASRNVSGDNSGNGGGYNDNEDWAL